MKLLLLLCSLFISHLLEAQRHQVERVWQTQAILKTPESVLYYPKGKFLFVSNIDGKTDEKDGKGSIAKVGLNGKIMDTAWVTGLNAPKGLGLYQNKLYVADLTEVTVIDILTAKIIQHIPVDGSVFLNDITIDKNGVVFVSDTRKFKVHRIVNGTVTTFLDSLKGPNGLLAVKNDLYILDRGSLLKADTAKHITIIATGMDKSTDGIEMVNEKEFIISCWSGIVYYLTALGDKEVLLDKRDLKINSADIGYNEKKKIIYVPTFNNNRVVAYKIKLIIRL